MPQIDIASVLPPGETPLTWFIKSQTTLNFMYAQLCAQTGTPAVQAPVTVPRGRATPAPRILSYDFHTSEEEAETYSQTKRDSNKSGTRRVEDVSQNRPSVHSRLGPRSSPRWDTQYDEEDQSYEGDSASVFNRLSRNHASHKPTSVSSLSLYIYTYIYIVYTYV